MDTQEMFADLPNERLCEGWLFWGSGKEGSEKIEELFFKEIERRGIMPFDLDAPDTDDLHKLCRFLTYDLRESGNMHVGFFCTDDWAFFWNLNPCNVGL